MAAAGVADAGAAAASLGIPAWGDSVGVANENSGKTVVEALG
jgi:hypothetical protein